MYEIYTLSDPRTDEVRYVGKATKSIARLKSHLRDARRRTTPVYVWIKELQDMGLSPTIAVIETTDQWIAAEIAAIARYKAEGHPLLNLSKGGNQPSSNPEANKRNGRANAHAVHSDPVRKRMWYLKQQLGMSLKKGYVNEKTIAKMRARPDVFGSLLHLVK